MLTSNPTTTPSKPISKDTSMGGVSPVSIFAAFDQPTPVKKKNTSVRNDASKHQSILRRELWTTVQQQTKGDWAAMHNVLKAQLTGKVQLEWAQPTVVPKIITLAPPTEKDHLLLQNKLALSLTQRNKLLQQRKEKLTGVSSLDEEKDGLLAMDDIYQAELTRWNQITRHVGTNQLTFPVQNKLAKFDPALPNLRNKSYFGGKTNPCTPEEMKQGEWGIEHKTLASMDANAIPFNLRKRTVDYDTLKLTTTVDEALSHPVNPSTQLRTHLNHARIKVVLSEQEKASREWGIEHKTVVPMDVNANAFPLTNFTLTEKTVLDTKAPMSIIVPDKVDPMTLRTEIYDGDSDTTMYSEDDAASLADSYVSSRLPEEGLTDVEMSFYQNFWSAQKEDGSSTMNTALDEHRLCQWKYFNKTNIVAEDKTSTQQDQVWKQRNEKPLAKNKKVARVHRLSKRFQCAVPPTAFFQECLKVARPEDKSDKLAQLQALELSVGWTGSLRADQVHDTLPSTPFECSLIEGREVAWDVLAIDIFAQDQTTPVQEATIAARLKRGPLSKYRVQHRIRQLATHFNGKRCERFWSNVTEKNFNEDSVKVALPENRAALLVQYQEKDAADALLKEARTQKMIAKRQSNISFYSNRSSVEELLKKKHMYFTTMASTQNFKFLQTKTSNANQALTLDASFFVTGLRMKKNTVVATAGTTGETKSSSKDDYVRMNKKRTSISF